jgi:transcription elongation GreA/GreB family factor
VPQLPSKDSLKAELIGVLSADLVVRERAYRSAHEGATDVEAKPENDKDTRALELSYLARGEAARLEEVRAALSEVQAMSVESFHEASPVRLGALVETAATEEDGQVALFWICAQGGGARLAGNAVQVLTPKSPLGRALLGAHAGDECEVTVGGKKRLVCVVSVS